LASRWVRAMAGRPPSGRLRRAGAGSGSIRGGLRGVGRARRIRAAAARIRLTTRAALAGIATAEVGDVPAGSLQLEGRGRDHPVERGPAALRAVGQGRVGELLQDILLEPTVVTTIRIDRHLELQEDRKNRGAKPGKTLNCSRNKELQWGPAPGPARDPGGTGRWPSRTDRKRVV